MSGIEQWFQQGQRVQDDQRAQGLLDTDQGGMPDFPEEGRAPAREPQQPDPISAWRQQGDQQLRQTLQQASQKNPDTAAEIDRLRARTGLPGELIERNLDTVREHAAAQDFDPRQFRQDFPALAGLLDDPDNATLAQDDLESLQLLEGTLKLAQQRYHDSTTLPERVWNRVREGALGLRQSLLGLPLVDLIEQGADARMTGDFMAARDPITGMPIPASQVTIGEEQQAQLTDAAGAMGRAAETEMARRIAPLQARAAQIEQRPATAAMMQAESWGEVFDAFLTDPLGIIADIGISSQTQQLPSLAIIMATRNPGLGIAASAGNLYALEAGGGVIQYLAGQGIDTSDPEAIVRALEDDGVARAAVEYAEQRGAVMATAGGLATGVASRMLVPGGAAGQSVGRDAANVFVAQPFAQGTIGASAEGSLQLMQEGEIAPGELFAEFIGEFAGAPLEAGSFTAERMMQQRRTPAVVEDAGRAAAAAGNAETLEAMGEVARGSRLRERHHEKFREFVERMRDGSGIESLQIPVERWNELFQSAGQDPAELAAQVTGDPRAYQEAMATGGDLVVPLAEYMDQLAGGELHAELSRDIRLHPGDMTQREAEAWVASTRDNVEEYLGTLAQPADDRSTVVYDDVLGQLLQAGRERSTAEREARLMQSVFRSLGERTGQDPAELFQRYNINVRRPMPEVLQQLRDTDMDIDPLLDRLRAGDIPTQRDAFGPSLMEFLRERGIRDEGGELAARDADADRRAFQRALIRDDGMTLDDAAQAAAEANYLPGLDRSAVTYQDLLDAIDRELRGEPVYSQDAGDSQTQDMIATLEELGDYLNELGVDLSSLDNAAVRALLAGDEAPAPAEGEAARTLDQAAFHGTPHRFDRFSLDAIGTGEGAQAYGWGLYFASRREIAEYYRDTLASAQAVYRDSGEPVSGIDEQIVTQMQAYGLTLDEIRRKWQVSLDQAQQFADVSEMMAQQVEAWQERLAALETFEERVDVRQVEGQLLQVDVPENSELLDWDAPMSQQPEQVQQALREWLAEYGDFHPMTAESLQGIEDTTGEGIYRALVRDTGSDRNASRTLGQIGIPGLRYEDAATRQGDGDARNFVVWDEERVTVEAVNDELRQAEAQEAVTTLNQGGTVTAEQAEASLMEGMTAEDRALFDDAEWAQMVEQQRRAMEEAQRPGVAQVSDLQAEMIEAYPALELFTTQRGDVVTVQRIELPSDQRDQGTGTRVMERIAEWADQNGIRLALTPVEDFGGSLPRLRDFYRRFGFEENIGRSRDLSISEAMVREPSQSLEQGGRQPRGRITFPQSRRFFNIELLERADLSTFIHESGHLYLEILTDLVQQPDAPQQLADDFQTILDWLGVDDADSIGTEQHEQWARGFEAYIMEGKAPSAELRSVFARFRAWLVAIYRTVASLNVELTDEVRGVMDRLVATDQEISDAASETHFQPLFEDAQAAGMSEAEYRAYQQAAERARTSAEEELTGKVMREYQRERKQWWREARARVRDEVAGEINQRPEYVAMAVLGRGKLPDGSPLPEGMEPFKLNRAALADRYGKEFLKRLPRPYVYSREGGVHPDVAAETFGYRSGDELVQALINARPRRQLIDAETERRMLETYGDMLNDGSLADEAINSLHSDRQGQMLQAELRALNRRTGRQSTPTQVIREAASRIIAEKAVREVQPYRYLQAEQKASREAFNALADGDHARAAEAKQRQLLNHHLYREAQKARDDVDAVVETMARYRKKSVRQRIAKAGEEYLQQIDALATRYEFRRATTLRQIDRRRSLEAWIAEQQEEGFTLDLPDTLLDDARVVNYREVPVEELRGLHDAVKQIEHLARTKNRLLASRDQREFEATVDGIVASIDSHRERDPSRPPLAETWKNRLATWAKDAHAWHVKPEFLFRWLDGDVEQGPVWQALFRPIADAEVAEQQLHGEVTAKLRDIMSAYTRQERAEWYGTKFHVAEVNQTFTKANVIAVALNWGNEYNRQVMMEGYGWSDRQVQAILQHMDARDWQMVQETWDLIDTLWPQISQLEKDLNGIAPEKVEALAFEPPGLPAGSMPLRGGYYPIKYDARASTRTFQREERSGDKLFENSYSRPATRQGHTKERQGSGGQLLRLDLNVLSEHFSQVIHDVTHRRAVMDVNRLANNKEVREAIEQTAGRELYRQIKPWLQAVANEMKQPESFWEKLVGRARTGGTVVNMGLKATTALAQPLGFFSSVDLLGERWAWKGLASFLGPNGPQGRGGYRAWQNMARATEFVKERSEAMRTRQLTFDRDVRDTLNRMTQETRAQELGRFYFYFTGMLDMAVSVPTWLGAYRKAMEGAVETIDAGNEVEAIAYADSIVRMSQSAGGVKDLARIQRGGQVQRAFVMFYSFFSAAYNQSARRISQAKRGEISLPRLAASAMYIWIVPALLGELIAGRGPEEEEEWGEWAVTNGILYPAGMVVGLRDVSNGVLTPFGYDASPAYDAFDMTARAARIPLKALDSEQDVTRGDVKAAFLATSYWAALPGRQAWITGEYLYDVATGEADPETPQEFVRNLFFTRPISER